MATRRRVVERRTEPPDIVDFAKGEHARQIDARQRQGARSCAGGEHQRVVTECPAVAEANLLSREIDGDCRRAELKLDLVVAPVTLAAQQQRVGGRPLLQERLRQGRPLIRRIGLVADHADRAGITALSQADRELRRGLAGADDENSG